MQHLFVYGSLSKGNTNEGLLNDIGGTWNEASLTGCLLEKGWGSAMGFPGLVLDKGGNEIKGYVFSSECLDKHWRNLDAFEGDEYMRVLTEVKLADSKLIRAYVYVLRESGPF